MHTVVCVHCLVYSYFDYYTQFDPHENMNSGGFCSTFNFRMTAHEFDLLHGLSRTNALSAESVIYEAIRAHTERS